MPKINLEENDLVRLFEAANDGYEPPEDLIGKLFPSFVEKLRQEGKFDAEALIRHKIPTIEYAGKRQEGVIPASASLLGQSAPLQAIRSFGEPVGDGWRNMIVQGDNPQFLKTVFLNQDALIKDKVKGKIKLIYIDRHTINIRIGQRKEKGAKPDYGNFAFELRKKDLKHFPVLFKFDDNFKFSGLTILR